MNLGCYLGYIQGNEILNANVVEKKKNSCVSGNIQEKGVSEYKWEALCYQNELVPGADIKRFFMYSVKRERKLNRN